MSEEVSRITTDTEVKTHLQSAEAVSAHAWVCQVLFPLASRLVHGEGRRFNVNPVQKQLCSPPSGSLKI